MEYDFSWNWFFAGLTIIVATIIFIRFHQWIADNFGSGVIDYDRYKLYALIALGIGFLSMLNFVPLLLEFIFSSLFDGTSGSDGLATAKTIALFLQSLV